MLEFIKNTYTFKATQEHNDISALNISYGVDRNFLFGAAVSMTSVFINNADIPIIVHLFTDYMDDDNLQRFEKLANQFSATINIYLINPECFSNLPTSYVWSYATYFRLLSFDYLSRVASKVLYLDADVVCKGSLYDIYTVDFSGNEYAAVIPDIHSMQNRSASRLDWPEVEGKYFNAGVMYVNLKRWHDEELTQKSLKLLRGDSKYGHLKYLDQDVLNIIFSMDNIYFNRDYNCVYTIKNELKAKNAQQYRETIKESVVLIHYTGATKPWHQWANYPSAQYFLNAWRQSPWSDIPLKHAEKLVEFKKKYKHELRQKKYLLSIISCVKYNKLKRKYKIK
jgi:UDP-glucose/galactose:(glucosyl)LPS alpha-1,2-glucosyl/galactosyltransferase